MAFRSRRARGSEAVRRPQPESDAQRNLFRRSRTLTGSLSSQIIAANDTATHLRSPRHKETALRVHRRRVGWLLFGVVASAVVVLWLFDQLITTPDVTFQPA